MSNKVLLPNKVLLAKKVLFGVVLAAAMASSISGTGNKPLRRLRGRSGAQKTGERGTLQRGNEQDGFTPRSTPSPLEEQCTAVTAWSGNKTLDSWNVFVSVPKQYFAEAAEGSKIRIDTYNITAAYHNLKLYVPESDWKVLTNGKYTGGSYNADGGVVVPRDTVEYTMTASDAEALKYYGFVINGFGIAVTNITVITQGTAAASEGSVLAGHQGTETRGQVADDDFALRSAPSPAVQAENGDVLLDTFPQSSQMPTDAPYAKHGKLHVTGAYLMDKNNEKYQLYGMSTHGLNFGPDFSRYINQDAMNTLSKDWNTSCIRLVLYARDYNGYCNGGNKEELKQLVSDGVEYASKAGMYVLIDWHVLSYNPQETKADAKEFLDYMSSKYKNYGNVLYEICNEPAGAPWSSAIKTYAKEVIPVIRGNAPDAVIIVGTNTWSQDVEDAARDRLDFDNVMYTFHFYADTHKAVMRTRVENAIKGGLPIFITEWGTCDASGNGGFNKRETQKWFDLIQKYNISHINWSLCNKTETASALKNSCNKTSGWTDDDLTESGKTVLQHFRTLSR